MASVRRQSINAVGEGRSVQLHDTVSFSHSSRSSRFVIHYITLVPEFQGCLLTIRAPRLRMVGRRGNGDENVSTFAKGLPTRKASPTAEKRIAEINV